MIKAVSSLPTPSPLGLRSGLVLAMLVGGLRAAEVRGLLLANVDMGLRRVRLTR